MNDLRPLQNLWIVVTRPADQAGGIIATIEELGGNPIPWPALKIEPINTSDQTRQHIIDLKTYDHLIFISVNAVNYGLVAIARHHIDLSLLLKNINVFAVGKTTAKALKKSDVESVHVPETASSKGLLDMSIFNQGDLSGKRCLIFRGKGGNETLAEGLSQRGALTVDYAEVYQRHAADSDPIILESHWQQKKLDIIIVTSIAGLDNIFAILGTNNQSQLCSTPLLTVSDRVAEYAKHKGFNQQVLVANSAIDKDIIATMQSWHQVREK